MRKPEFKGSPRPWEVANSTPGWKDIVRDANGECIAIGAAKRMDVSEANMRLTAAAPELLEALMDMIDTFDPEKQALYSFAKNKIDKAKNAIKKALEG